MDNFEILHDKLLLQLKVCYMKTIFTLVFYSDQLNILIEFRIETMMAYLLRCHMISDAFSVYLHCIGSLLSAFWIMVLSPHI